MKRLMVIAKIPTRLRKGDLALRPLRIWDGPFLARMMSQEDILRSCGTEGRPGTSWFALYRRLRSFFFLSYCIEYASEKVGLAGLYNLQPDKSAEMSLVISKASCRRIGLGTKVFRLLADGLEGAPFLERVVVSVRTDNVAAQSFWTKLGFHEVRCLRDTRQMTLPLRKCAAASADRFPGGKP
ncbi:MAG: GNAT family N-acetyltransferase [Nitrospiraceae bacterium]|nr:GNAT family N-acetyltransferase [Nitrospiraceae bacterium]